MHGNSSPESSPWWEVALDWPVEHVACQLEVVEPRLLTALEWALLRVLEAFEDAPPSLEEMAEELGLGEPRFLADVLKTLLSQEALGPRPGVITATQLAHVVFTERGRELYRKGQVDGAPSSQGRALCFDVITDENLPADTQGASQSKCPVIEPSQLTRRREEVGLERVRAIVRQLGPPVGGADALIRAVRVLAEGVSPKLPSGFRWVKHPIAFVRGAEGRLDARTPSLTSKQRQWLLARPLEQWAHPARAITEGWASHPSFRRGGQRLETWCATVDRLLPVADTLPEAKRLLAGARREVLLHAAWACAPGIQEALLATAHRGVAVYVIDAVTTQVREWTVRPQHAPGFVIEVLHPGMAPGALVVDGREALLLDEVSAEVTDLGRHAFEVVGVARTRAAELRAELCKSLLEELPSAGMEPPPPLDVLRASAGGALLPGLLEEPWLRWELARLALQPTPEGWSRLEAGIAHRRQGADRVEAIQGLADLVNRLIPDERPAPWRGAATSSWRAFHLGILTLAPRLVPDEVLRSLIRLAPAETTSEALLDPLIHQWLPAGHTVSVDEDLGLLARLRGLVEARWKGQTEKCPGFMAALEQGLRVGPPPLDARALTERARRVATVASVERARRWAWDAAALWPAPHLLQDLEPWRRHHEPLRDLLGASLSAHHARHWKALVTASPASTEEHLSEQLRLAQDVMAPSESVAIILATQVSDELPVQVERLVSLRRASRRAWKQHFLNDAAWNLHLRALLAAPRREDSPEVHGPLAAALTSGLRDWPGADLCLREWAQALVKLWPSPHRVAGVAWWLETLQGLARTLGPDLQRVASTILARHVGALRDARQRQDTTWTQVLEAWRGLGLAPESLESVIAPQAPAGAANRPEKPDKKRRKS